MEFLGGHETLAEQSVAVAVVLGCDIEDEDGMAGRAGLEEDIARPGRSVLIARFRLYSSLALRG